MKLLIAEQTAPIETAVTAKFCFTASVIVGTLYGLAQERAARLGGYDRVTLWDLAREFRAGFGDAGICFEWAVHDAIARRDNLIWPLVSEVLEDHCGIADGADSLLFGPEKDGRIPVLSTVQGALTDDSRVYVGTRGQPPKLKSHLPTIIRAFRRQADRDRLPAAISGLWKADLFVGSAASQRWVGTSVKINPKHLEGANGLRLGVYPRQDAKDAARFDKGLNLVRVPLPYDAAFMETFYKSFFLLRAFLDADAKVPAPIDLPDAEDRYIAGELEKRRDYPAAEVAGWLRRMGQHGLIAEATASASADVEITAVGLAAPQDAADATSVTPVASSDF